MQNEKQQSQTSQQHTSSRMLKSLIHTYTDVQRYQSSYIAESQATVHDINYEDAISYRSNNSEKQESRLIELMEKKESQLKSLQSFLIKEFEQINENKQKHAQIKTQMEGLSTAIIELKAEAQSCKGLCNELEQMKLFMNSQMQNLIQRFANERQAFEKQTKQWEEFSERTNRAYQESKQLYEQQVSQLQSVVKQKEKQIQQLKFVTNDQARQITKLNDQLAHNLMSNSSEPFKLQEEHLNKPISKRDSVPNLAEEDLEVSFSADKNKKAKQLINAIYHLKSNQSLLYTKDDNSDIRIRNHTEEEEPQRQAQRTFTGEFNHILLKGSTSSQSEHDRQLSENESKNSPAEQSQDGQTSEVRRINSSTNCVGNDASSAINKLDVFSELNRGQEYQDDDLSNYRQYEDEKYSEIEFRNMRKAKISRSLKATRNPIENGRGKDYRAEEKHSEIRHTTQSYYHHQVQTTEPQGQPSSGKKQNLNLKQPSCPQNEHPKQTAMEESFHRKAPTPSRQNNSPKDSLQSPNKKKKIHRYDYCRLYEEQQIKEIQNINTLCNHLILNDKSNPLLSSGSQLLPFSTFDKNSGLPRQLTPSRKVRQMSPRKSSYSKLELSRFEPNYNIENSKGFVRSEHGTVPSFSPSKKPLTIQIPVSPQRADNSNQRSLPNPYLKLQKHLHQISCHQFSPSRSRHVNEKTNSGYLDRSDMKSKASYSDLRNEMRTESRHDEFLWEKKHSIQDQAYHPVNLSRQTKKQRQRLTNTVNEPIITSNNADRKDYIKAKIEMIKKKNTIQNNPVTKSPNKISFLKSEQPENHLSKHQLERPVVSRPFNRSTHNRSMYEHNEGQVDQVKGYDFNEDKFEKQMMEKSRRTDKSQLQNSTISKIDKSKDVSRVSYANGGNNSFTRNDKIERSAINQKENYKKPSSNVTWSEDDQLNDIYGQLNHNMAPHSQRQRSQHTNLGTPQSISKKTLNRPVEQARQSVSPLRPTTRNTNTMYLPQDNNRSMKKPAVMTDNQPLDERYNEDNLYKHPYMMDRRRGKDARGNRNEDNSDFETMEVFRRF